MATEKQIEANRLNALKSTGPKSDEGKAVSRFNALTHGMASALPEASAFIENGKKEYQELHESWRAELRPEGVEQEWLVDLIVAESVRVERCQQAFFVECAKHSRNASERWDADRSVEAETLASGLARNPGLVSKKLQETPHGCDLLIRRWKGLRSSLDVHRTWTENQRSHALDLLGIHPDFRDAETPVDPISGDPFEARAAVVESEIRRLTVVREASIRSDETERALAEQTIGAEFTKPVQLLDRYERNALRRQQWAWRRLDAAKRGETSEPVKSKPAAAPPPPISPTPKPIAKPSTLAILAPPEEPKSQPRVAPAPVPQPARPVGNRRQRLAAAARERRA